MKITEKQKLVLALAIFGITGFIIYTTFFAPSSSTGPSDAEIASTTEQQVGQDILDLSDKLNSISIDSNLFSSGIFKNLIDFDLPLSPEPQGRPNPFTTIGNDNGVVVPINIATTTKK